MMWETNTSWSIYTDLANTTKNKRKFEIMEENLNIVGRLEILAPNEPISMLVALQEDLYYKYEKEKKLDKYLNKFVTEQMAAHCSKKDQTQHRISLRVDIISVTYENFQHFEKFYVWKNGELL